jgi:hypothetical protein
MDKAACLWKSFLDIGQSNVLVRVLQHGWKSKGTRFEKEGKGIARKTKGIDIKELGVE